MTHHKETKSGGLKMYLGNIVRYHFSPKLRSILSILYFLFFLYFLIFYLGHIFLAVRFVFHTIFSKTALQGPDSMIWGALFVIALLLPSILVAIALIFPYEIKKNAWPKSTRLVIIGLSAMIILALILFVDFSLGYIESREPIKCYLDSRGIVIPQ